MPTSTLYLPKDGRCLNLLSRWKCSLKRICHSLPSLLCPSLTPAQAINACCLLIQTGITVQKAYIVPSTPKSYMPSWPVLIFHTHFVPKRGFWWFSLYFYVPKQNFLPMGEENFKRSSFAEWKVDKCKQLTFFQILYILTPETGKGKRWISDSSSMLVLFKAEN